MKKIWLVIAVLLASINMTLAAVNINTASQTELETLKGIGPAKAKAIVEDRAKNGPFKSVDDLDRVKGFGKKSVDKLRNNLTISGGNSSAAPTPKTTASKAKRVPMGKPATAPATK
ncbi:hypothetical protein TPL01_00860 [Sulfuriferula plumbiphila]|uniref:Helix-hairpin-helix DNA-binding motif class 1 domain-containing protein n=2 Tax=Sulfuriferula plumbiphila TaxID=171865 RepID=A0A512L396_9PROT|nr:ComEA family DNA-binding protein [Sulfuriferula plumbiphila]BBP02654.1 hypothetical protein SFPGR_00760 [Sulfuriferula plumbiphila]GEP28948.1 hypothetical protein TPL01_00860 [Sulfuriferula plumbiphila]